jgi:hypothetical protein
MNRKTLLVVITLVFALVVAGLIGGYFYLTNTKAGEDKPTVQGTGSLAENGESGNGSTDTTTSTSTEGIPIPRIRHLTSTPVAGYDFVDTGKGGYVIWYVDRGNGNIFQTATSTLEITRVTNTTIPKVYEAYIGKGGANVILRTLNETTDSIQTFVGSPKARVTTATSSDNTKELSGVFTSDTISFMSLAPTKDKFFGMAKGVSGMGNIYNWPAKSTNIFTHALKSWIPQWANANAILLTSAPSAKTQNVAYFLNPTTKAFTKVLGPKNGLVASASSDASQVLFSENKGNTLVFGKYDVKTGAETTIQNGTIPDKCVWSKKDVSLVYCGFPQNSLAGIFPDDWYQGKRMFTDSLKALDVTTLQTRTVSDLQADTNTEIDATNLMLSSDEKYLLFTNKRDLTLWMIAL